MMSLTDTEVAANYFKTQSARKGDQARRRIKPTPELLVFWRSFFPY
jgi:hypothetical protein